MALANISKMLLKLRLSDTLSFGEEKVGRNTQRTLNVNDSTIYFLGSLRPVDPPYKVSRTVFGTMLKIPSAYPSYYRFEEGRYLDSRGVDE